MIGGGLSGVSGLKLEISLESSRVERNRIYGGETPQLSLLRGDIAENAVVREDFCSGLKILTDTVGVLDDGIAPVYKSSSRCSWLLQPTGVVARAVNGEYMLRFKQLEVEVYTNIFECYDAIMVRLILKIFDSFLFLFPPLQNVRW